MVELRKRPAPPPAPPPAKKKKAAAKPKAKKDDPPTKKEDVPASKTKVKAMDSSSPPKVGDTITLSNFGGEISTHDSTKTTLATLVDESKAGVVLFTYPKASTPGCTTQACLFRDAYTPLTATGLSIYGLSADSPAANTSFKSKQNLPYPLLCDPQQTLIAAIGMKKTPSGTTRGVFVVDKMGKVLAAEPGGPAPTVEVVKKVVGTMGTGEEAKAMDKRVADVAAEVADTAATMDRSKQATPVNG